MLSQCKVLIFPAAALCICIQRTASDIIFSVFFFFFFAKMSILLLNVSPFCGCSYPRQVRNERNIPRNKVFPPLPTIQNTRHVCFCNPETQGQASFTFSSYSLFSRCNFLEFYEHVKIPRNFPPNSFATTE